MKKVALVDFEEIYGELDTMVVMRSITEWQEISDEDYGVLINAVRGHANLRCITFIEKQKESIRSIIDTYLEKTKKQEQAKEEAKKKAAAKRAANALQKIQKDKESKKELLERLKRELGE